MPLNVNPEGKSLLASREEIAELETDSKIKGYNELRSANQAFFDSKVEDLTRFLESKGVAPKGEVSNLPAVLSTALKVHPFVAVLFLAIGLGVGIAAIFLPHIWVPLAAGAAVAFFIGVGIFLLFSKVITQNAIDEVTKYAKNSEKDNRVAIAKEALKYISDDINRDVSERVKIDKKNFKNDLALKDGKISGLEERVAKAESLVTQKDAEIDEFRKYVKDQVKPYIATSEKKLEALQNQLAKANEVIAALKANASQGGWFASSSR